MAAARGQVTKIIKVTIIERWKQRWESYPRILLSIHVYACIKDRCENILEVGWNGCNDLNQRLSYHQAIPETETAVRWTTTRCA